jgi:hypothetical protein
MGVNSANQLVDGMPSSYGTSLLYQPPLPATHTCTEASARQRHAGQGGRHDLDDISATLGRRQSQPRRAIGYRHSPLLRMRVVGSADLYICERRWLSHGVVADEAV